MLTFREALGGPWAANLIGWFVLLVPTALLVVLQESATDFPGVWVLIALALSEHVAAGVVIGAIVLVARRRWPIIPLGVLFPMWILAGVARGLVWAALAATIGNDHALLPYRITTWVGISVLWSPLFTYTLAQLDHRRLLLARLATAQSELASERARSQLSASARRGELIAAVHSTISPVIREIHRSLDTISSNLDRTTLANMSERLSIVAFETARLVTPAPPRETATRPSAIRAPLATSLDFPQERPFLAAGLAGLTLLPLIVPDAWRVHGPIPALYVLLSLAVIVVTLAGSLVALQRLRSRRGKPPEWLFAVTFLVPGLAGSVTLFLAMHGILLGQLAALLFILPLGALFAGACLSAAVGLAFSNQGLADEFEATAKETTDYRRRAESADSRARNQVAELLHGPVHGRLSACAMALNFYTSGLGKPDATVGDDVTETVLEYLSAASLDLDALAST